MKIIIVISSIILPIMTLYVHRNIKKSALVFNTLAVISAVMFGNIAASSIYQVIIDDTVFMTTIHKIFLNPLFLLTGAYLGVYMLYRLLIITLQVR